MTWSSTGPIARSGGVKPGTSALVESTRNRSTPLFAETGELAQVGEAAVERQLVHLEVTGGQTVPAAEWMTTARASGIEWFTATNSRSNGPIASMSGLP